MPKVMLEMEMPRSCFKCFAYKVDLPFSFCRIRKKDIRLNEYKRRPSWCPLQEVKE